MKVYIATSRDGFIATTDGQVDWLHELPHPRGGVGFDEFMDGIDYVLMGRKTYESGLRECEKHGIEWPYRKPVHVLTHRPVNEGPGMAIEGTPEEILERLGDNGYVDGGQTIRYFIGSIESLVVTVCPTTLGAGIPLLDVEQLSAFTLRSETPLTDGWLQRIYVRT
jgi:dihydrofolate reductase